MKKQNLSAVALGDLLGISERRVRTLREAGVLPGTATDPYDMRECVRAYCRHPRPASGRAAAGGAETVTLNEARISVLTEQAQRLRMQNEETERHIVVAEVAARLVGEEYARVRTRMLAIPTGMVALVLRWRTPMEAQQLLEREITRALEELSDPEGIVRPETRAERRASPRAEEPPAA